MSEHADYNAESEDYKIRGGETPFTGDNITGEEGALVIAIPSARYPEGKTATAKDADLTPGNVKKDIDIFGTVGTYEGAPKFITVGVVEPSNPIPDTMTSGVSHVIT